jgi:hypothetical protein
MVTLLLLGSMARALTGTLGTAVHSHILFTGLLWILQVHMYSAHTRVNTRF